MSKNENASAVAENPTIENETIEETGLYTDNGNEGRDANQPEFDWVSFLSCDEVNPYYKGARRGAKELDIAGMTPDDYCRELIEACRKDKNRSVVRILVDGKDFQTSNKSNLDSNQKRVYSALTKSKRPDHLRFEKDNLIVQKFEKGMIANDKPLPNNFLRLTYRLSQEHYDRYTAYLASLESTESKS